MGPELHTTLELQSLGEKSAGPSLYWGELVLSGKLNLFEFHVLCSQAYVSAPLFLPFPDGVKEKKEGVGRKKWEILQHLVVAICVMI